MRFNYYLDTDGWALAAAERNAEADASAHRRWADNPPAARTHWLNYQDYYATPSGAST